MENRNLHPWNPVRRTRSRRTCLILGFGCVFGCAHGPATTSENSQARELLEHELGKPELSANRKASLELLLPIAGHLESEDPNLGLKADQHELLKSKTIDPSNPWTYFFLGANAARLNECAKSKTWFSQARAYGLPRSSYLTEQENSHLSNCGIDETRR